VPATHDEDIDALGQIARSADRTAVVRHLSTHPGDYFGAIHKATGISVGSLGKHLRDLEAAGIIVGDLPLEQRKGRTVRYHVDDKRLRTLVKKLERRLLGQ